MIITAIERTRGRRARVDVYVDGERAFDLARDAARNHALRPGRPIDRPEIDAIVAADVRRQALDTAAAMLARRPRSEREIRRRLAQRRFEPSLIDATIDKLRSARLVDDAEYARSWAETRERTSPRGRRMIVQELRANGVESSIAVAAAETVDEDEAAYTVASKRARSLGNVDLATFRSRLAGLLQRRGFGWEITKVTVERCWREFGDPSASEDDRPEAIE